MVEYWRARVKVDRQYNRSEEAWSRGEVGSWYGSWTHEDFRDALTKRPEDPWDYIRRLPHQIALGWEEGIRFYAPMKRFVNIQDYDWIVMYPVANRKIGVAQLEGPMKSKDNHPLNHGRKYLNIEA